MLKLKMEVIKLLIVLLAVLVMLFVVPSAAALGIHLQAGGPDIATIVIGGILFVLLVIAVSMGATQTTEVVKVIVALLARTPWTTWLPQGGIWSWIYAGLVAIAGVFGFGIDIFSPIDIFKNVDPQLVQYLGTVIVWLLSTYLYKVFYRKDGDPSPSQQVRSAG